jgi:hypothetical protein
MRSDEESDEQSDEQAAGKAIDKWKKRDEQSDERAVSRRKSWKVSARGRFGCLGRFGLLGKVWVWLLDSGVGTVRRLGRHLVLERFAVGRHVGSRLGCMREVRMSMHVCCVGMSTHVSCEHRVYKGTFCCVLSSSSFSLMQPLYSIRLINVATVPPFPLISPFRRRSSSIVHFCLTRPSDAVRSRLTRPSDAVRSLADTFD